MFLPSNYWADLMPGQGLLPIGAGNAVVYLVPLRRLALGRRCHFHLRHPMRRVMRRRGLPLIPGLLRFHFRDCIVYLLRSRCLFLGMDLLHPAASRAIAILMHVG